MGKNNLTIRGSGFGLYFFIFLIILFPAGLLIRNPSAPLLDIESTFPIEAILLVVIYLCFLSQSVSLDESSLDCNLRSPSRGPKSQLQKFRIYLSDIDSVTVATINYYEKHADKFTDKGLIETVHFYRNLKTVPTYLAFPFRIPIGWVFSSLILIYVAPKLKSDEGITISSKPFSKHGIKKLISEFKKRNIPLNIEPSLVL
jgi:hypothetical protein